MSKKRYDVIIPMGMGCAASQSLRRVGLQHLSFPGDWIAPIYGEQYRDSPPGDLAYRAETFCTRPDDFFCAEDFVLIGPHPWNGMDMYGNSRTHYIFNHDFKHGVPFAEALNGVREKYRRRFDRLELCLKPGASALIFRLDRPDVAEPTPDADLRSAQSRLAARYPSVDFEILNFRCCRGTPVTSRQINNVSPGVVTVSFDYHNPSSQVPAYQPDFKKVTMVLREMVDVRDYRTDEERRAWKKREQRERWMKLGAKNAIEYRVRKLALAIRRVKSWLPKRCYDLAIPMGIACSCSQVLREAGLQYLSLPNDWAGPEVSGVDDEGDLCRRADAICSGFDHWLDIEDFVFVRSCPEQNEMHYRNRRTRNFHPHDFKCDKPFNEEYPAIRARYDRRIARLLSLIDASRRILLVRIDRPDQETPTPESEIKYAYDRLRARYPDKRFELVHLTMERDRSPRNCRVERIANGIVRLSCDYANHLDNGSPVWFPNLKAAASCLAARYRVRDYRTEQERNRMVKDLPV